jgi:hypothetical protein
MVAEQARPRRLTSSGRNEVTRVTTTTVENRYSTDTSNAAVIKDYSRGGECQYYNGEKWITRKANNQLLKLFENTNSLITDPFDRPELEKTLKFINENKKYQTKINTILESKTFAKSLFDESDKENLDKRQEILDELKLIFYSHKDEILKICV